jgi:leucyl/phenylalanyl-tRNA--protein transferase
MLRVKSSIPVLRAEPWFPEPDSATSEGLVAIGGDLSAERLLLGYRSGIFPWTVAPLTWWSPDPRGIFELNAFHVSGSLAKVLNKKPFRITTDQACRQVIEACARSRPGRRTTWISPEFIEAYTRMHRAGCVHSVECWQDGRLVGGIYGVALGGLFAGESMFHEVNNASKVALYYLVRHLKEHQFSLFDIQMVTPITRQLGATEISRQEYLRRLGLAVEQSCSF